MKAIDVGSWLETARTRLSPSTPQPLLEAHALLGHALSQPRAWLLAHPEARLTAAEQAGADSLLERLLTGEPLPYILGRQEFYGLEFEVTPAVLIPRPETELLVEEALSWLKANPARRTAAEAATGSGCIAAALAVHCRDLSLAASDLSLAALRVAGRNLARHALRDSVHLLCCDLLSAVSGPFDLLCANLPYIPSASLSDLAVSRHEPRLALDGGPDGLDLIARLLADVPRLVSPGGLILLEIEAGQGESAPALARCVLPAARVTLHNDLAGLPRLLRIELPSAP